MHERDGKRQTEIETDTESTLRKRRSDRKGRKEKSLRWRDKGH